MASQLDLALAQFTGFKHGKWNKDDCLGLAISMGLTKKEWLKLKKQEIEIYLDKYEIEEIDNHFKINTNE